MSKMLEATVINTINYSFKGFPVVGEAKLIEEVKAVLFCEWSGNVYHYAIATLDKVPMENFLPQDKGIPGIYGCDKTGRVIMSIVLYEGNPKSSNPLERDQHFYVKAAEHTGDY